MSVSNICTCRRRTWKDRGKTGEKHAQTLDQMPGQKTQEIFGVWLVHYKYLCAFYIFKTHSKSTLITTRTTRTLIMNTDHNKNEDTHTCLLQPMNNTQPLEVLLTTSWRDQRKWVLHLPYIVTLHILWHIYKLSTTHYKLFTSSVLLLECL